MFTVIKSLTVTSRCLKRSRRSFFYFVFKNHFITIRHDSPFLIVNLSHIALQNLLPIFNYSVSRPLQLYKIEVIHHSLTTTDQQIIRKTTITSRKII